MEQEWKQLKAFIQEAAHGNPGDTGHGLKRGYRTILELMRLIEEHDAQDIYVDGQLFRFRGCDEGTTILSGRRNQ